MKIAFESLSSKVELRHFRYFLIVAEEKNFSRAAQRLHIAQPALSRQIKQLEVELGCALFQRLPRGVELTPAGSALLDHVKHIMVAINAACTQVRKLASGVLGVVKIGLNDIASSMPVVPEAINAHRRAYADVELQLSIMTSPHQVEALRRGTLDVGFLYSEPEHNPDLSFEVLEDYTLVLALHKEHSLAKRKAVKLIDLAGENFVWFPRQKYPWIHDKLLNACAAKGFSPRIVQEVDGMEPQLNVLSTGMGVGLVHSTLMERPHKYLTFRRVQDLEAHWPLYIAWRSTEESIVVKNFVGAVLARLRKTKVR